MSNHNLSSIRTAVRLFIEQQLCTELRDISLKIYNHPELSFQETFASTTIRHYLSTKPGITVTNSNAHDEIPTAFIATFEHMIDGKPSDQFTTLGFCSEYDALPMGHACGHNLICISGIGVFLTTAYLMRQYSIPGRLYLFGTPGEEGLGGKINMIRCGDFIPVDFAMMLHPGNIDLSFPRYLALQGFDVEYFGREAHASGAPWEGINALDGIITAYNAVSQLRQQIFPSDRVHGIITNGGAAANIIPAYTKGSFMVRSTSIGHLKSNLLPRVMSCMEAGAKASGCTIKTTLHPTYYDVNINSCMTQVYMDELRAQLQIELPSASEQRQISRGSTDMGNVTYVVPGIHNVYDIGCKAEIHSQEFLVHAKTEEAHTKTLDRVACFVMVSYQLLINSELRQRVKKEYDSTVKEAEVKNGIELRGYD